MAYPKAGLTVKGPWSLTTRTGVSADVRLTGEDTEGADQFEFGDRTYQNWDVVGVALPEGTFGIPGQFDAVYRKEWLNGPDDDKRTGPGLTWTDPSKTFQLGAFYLTGGKYGATMFRIIWLGSMDEPTPAVELIDDPD